MQSQIRTVGISKSRFNLQIRFQLNSIASSARSSSRLITTQPSHNSAQQQHSLSHLYKKRYYLITTMCRFEVLYLLSRQSWGEIGDRAF